MTRTIMGVFMLVAMGRCGHVGEMVVSVASKSGTTLQVQVRNDTGNDVVLVSPSMPMRQVDSEGCSLTLSSKLIAAVQPYDFTPQLVTVARGKTYEVTLAGPAKQHAQCTKWDVTVEYSYVTAEQLSAYRNRSGEELRRFLLANQQTARSHSVVEFSP